LWGAKKTILVGGKEKEITVDADYIRKSIYNPDEEIVQGFSKGLMRSYTGVISNDDMDKIIEYLKTIKQ
jgi:cytochrome c oxidase subunit II